jgi:hypothetical protein
VKSLVCEGLEQVREEICWGWGAGWKGERVSQGVGVGEGESLVWSRWAAGAEPGEPERSSLRCSAPFAWSPCKTGSDRPRPAARRPQIQSCRTKERDIFSPTAPPDPPVACHPGDSFSGAASTFLAGRRPTDGVPNTPGRVLVRVLRRPGIRPEKHNPSVSVLPTRSDCPDGDGRRPCRPSPTQRPRRARR